MDIASVNISGHQPVIHSDLVDLAVILRGSQA